MHIYERIKLIFVIIAILDESNLHQIYEDKGKFNFAFQAPKIVISSIISTFVLRLILQFLVLTDKDIFII